MFPKLNKFLKGPRKKKYSVLIGASLKIKISGTKTKIEINGMKK